MLFELLLLVSPAVVAVARVALGTTADIISSPATNNKVQMDFRAGLLEWKRGKLKLRLLLRQGLDSNLTPVFPSPSPAPLNNPSCPLVPNSKTMVVE